MTGDLDKTGESAGGGWESEHSAVKTYFSRRQALLPAPGGRGATQANGGHDALMHDL